MEILSKQDVQRIKAEHQKYLDDEETLHNQEMHQRILATWKASSPKMYLRLRTQGVLEAMAFVAQQRMWKEQSLLIRGGMPITDAREQAERAHLMLEPEDDPQQMEDSGEGSWIALQQALDDGRTALLRAGL